MWGSVANSIALADGELQTLEQLFVQKTAAPMSVKKTSMSGFMWVGLVYLYVHRGGAWLGCVAVYCMAVYCMAVYCMAA